MTGAVVTRTPRVRRSLPLTGSRVGSGVLIATTVVFAVVVAIATIIAPFDPTAIVGPARTAPSLDHLLGTDQLGRDVLSRTLVGGQQTLLMALGSAALAGLLGIPIGVVAGYFGRWQAGVIMRGMDVLLAFPGILFGLIVITVLGAGVGSTILAVGLAFVPVVARIVYGVTQRVTTEEYIAAARVIGCGPLRIMVRHVLPVIGTQLVVLMSSAIGWAALLCAALSFLGFGVQPPSPEWGADLGTGVDFLSQAWWISFGPGLGLTLTIFLANFLGDYLAARLDAQPVVAAESKSLT